MGRGGERIVDTVEHRERRSRGVEVGHEHVEREGREIWKEGEGMRRQSVSRKARERGGASSPFYSESGTPGCCQVTVGRSLDKMLTDSVEINTLT